jgi:hypothetical protein
MPIGSLVSHKEYADKQTRPGNCALILGSSYTKIISPNNLRKMSKQITGHKKLESSLATLFLYPNF